MLQSPGSKDFFVFSYLVIYGNDNLTDVFFSLLEKLREDVATTPFQLGPPLEVKYLIEYSFVLLQIINPKQDAFLWTPLTRAPEPGLTNNESLL